MHTDISTTRDSSNDRRTKKKQVRFRLLLATADWMVLPFFFLRVCLFVLVLSCRDEEFDKLKASLRESGSPVAVSTEPKCYIDTGICTVTFTVGNFLLLNTRYGIRIRGGTLSVCLFLVEDSR